jgi:hypothetical protein
MAADGRRRRLWSRAHRLVAANKLADGACAVVSIDVNEAAASVERFTPGDGWRALYAY